MDEKVEEEKVEIVEETVSRPDPKQNYKIIAEKLREAVTSTNLPDISNWIPPMIDLPAGIEAGLRRYAKVAPIPKGSTKAVLTTITTPSFTELTEGTAPSDAAQTITNVEIGTKRAFEITASHRVGAEVVIPDSVVKIYTA